MAINLCDESSFPFRVRLKVTAEDAQLQELHIHLEKEALSHAGSYNYRRAREPSQKLRLPACLLQPLRQRKTFFESILAHPKSKERGLTIIKAGHPGHPCSMAYMPSAARTGSIYLMSKSDFRIALAELLQIGWLLPPEENNQVFVYELTAEAKTRSGNPSPH